MHLVWRGQERGAFNKSVQHAVLREVKDIMLLQGKELDVDGGSTGIVTDPFSAGPVRL